MAELEYLVFSDNLLGPDLPLSWHSVVTVMKR